jgi:tetratricopeptide (TPR) repeat protein
LAIDREATLKNAEKFLRAGRLDAAIAEYVRVVEDQPKDWTTVNALGDLYVRAGQPGKAVPLYGRVASHLFTEGFYPRAAALLKKILKITPDDEQVQLRLAEISTQLGLLADARSYYAAVERRRREQGDVDGANQIVVRLGTLDPEDLDARLAAARALERGGRRAEAARLYQELYAPFLEAGRARDAAACIDAAVDAYAAAGEFGAAAALLQQFAPRAPSQVPVLLRLVEICIDGDLGAAALDAQARLAEAYLAEGRLEEARVIAEDLVARDPNDSVHADRLRRTLRALNVVDADDDLDPPDPVPPPKPAMEIDLTDLLLELQGRTVLPEPAPRPAPELEEVFQEIRAEVDRGGDPEEASDHFELARTYLDMGMRAEAIESLQAAARSPRWRFAASVAIGEMYRDDGDVRGAIEWFERAAEVPPPGEEQGRALLYDLGDMLETVGETARALAVFLELSADAPGYRDVSDRAARLARVETEG